MIIRFPEALPDRLREGLVADGGHRDDDFDEEFVALRAANCRLRFMNAKLAE